MRLSRLSRSWSRWLLALVALGTIGCATTKPRPVPLTQEDVKAMVASGLTDEDVIRRIDSTGTVFVLSADDVVRLREGGLSDRLVTYMLDTKTRAAVDYERRRSSYYAVPYPYYGFGFGYDYARHPRHCR